MQAVFQKGKLILNAGVFSLGPGKPALRINGGNLALRCVGGNDAAKHSTLDWRGRGVALTQRIDRESQTRIRISLWRIRLRRGDCLPELTEVIRPVSQNCLPFWTPRMFHMGGNHRL